MFDLDEVKVVSILDVGCYSASARMGFVFHSNSFDSLTGSNLKTVTLELQTSWSPKRFFFKLV